MKQTKQLLIIIFSCLLVLTMTTPSFANGRQITVTKKWEDGKTGTEAENRDNPVVHLTSVEPESLSLTITKECEGDGSDITYPFEFVLSSEELSEAKYEYEGTGIYSSGGEMDVNSNSIEFTLSAIDSITFKNLNPGEYNILEKPHPTDVYDVWCYVNNDTRRLITNETDIFLEADMNVRWVNHLIKISPTDSPATPTPRPGASQSEVEAVISGLTAAGYSNSDILEMVRCTELLEYDTNISAEAVSHGFQQRGVWKDLLYYGESITDFFEYIPESDPGVQHYLENYRGRLTLYNSPADYPIMQGQDDLYFAIRDTFGQTSLTGAIYKNSESSPDFSDDYQIIYGHHMDNGAMFGSIVSGNLDEGCIIAPDGIYRLRSFAEVETDAYDRNIYHILTTAADILEFFENDGDDVTTILDYQADVAHQATKVVALSTCSHDTTNGRYVQFYSMERVSLYTLEVNGYDGIYDGQPHSVEAIINPYADASYSFSEDGGETWQEGLPEVTDVGSYSYEIKADLGNEGYLVESCTINIEPAPAMVTANDIQIYEGDTLPALTADVEGLHGDDQIEYSLSANGFSGTPGTYFITPQGAELQGNYIVTYVPGTLTVMPRVYSITFSILGDFGDLYAFPYDGNIVTFHWNEDTLNNDVVSVTDGRVTTSQYGSLVHLTPPEFHDQWKVHKIGAAPSSSDPFYNDIITSPLTEDLVAYTRCDNVSPTCFVKGTKVWTPSGQKNIEDIEAGDTVLSYNDLTEEVVNGTVKNTISDSSDSVYDITIGSEHLKVTGEHEMYLPLKSDYVAVKELKEGDIFLTKDGEQVPIDSIELLSESVDVYNLDIDTYSNYFVGTSGFLSYNMNIPDKNGVSKIQLTPKELDKSSVNGNTFTFDFAYHQIFTYSSGSTPPSTIFGYTITPDPDSPPIIGGDGTYHFRVDGTDSGIVNFSIQTDTPGYYKYTIKSDKTPTGKGYTYAEDHVFGVNIKEQDGELIIKGITINNAEAKGNVTILNVSYTASPLPPPTDGRDSSQPSLSLSSEKSGALSRPAVLLKTKQTPAQNTREAQPSTYESYISEQGTHSNVHWVHVSDDTWTYTFTVNSADGTYYAWEEEMDGYESDCTYDSYATITGNSVTITNSKDFPFVPPTGVEKKRLLPLILTGLSAAIFLNYEKKRRAL